MLFSRITADVMGVLFVGPRKLVLLRSIFITAFALSRISGFSRRFRYYVTYIKYAVECLAFLLRFRELAGSDLGLDTECTDRCLPWFFSVPVCICRGV